MNYESYGIEEYDPLVAALKQNESVKVEKIQLDMKHREFPLRIPTILEAHNLELKALNPHLRYVFQVDITLFH